MKKIAFALILGLVLQCFPSRVHATIVGPSSGIGALLAAGLVSLVVLGDDNAAHKPSANASGNEFQDLNNNPAFKSLLNQRAGGTLNTSEILK